MIIYKLLNEMAKIKTTLPDTLYRYMCEDELIDLMVGKWGNFVDWEDEMDGADTRTRQQIIKKNGSHENEYFKSLYINPNLRGVEKKDFSGNGYEILVAFDTNALRQYGNVTPYDACVGVNEKEARLWTDSIILNSFDPETAIKAVYYKKIDKDLIEELEDMGIQVMKLKGKIQL